MTDRANVSLSQYFSCVFCGVFWDLLANSNTFPESSMKKQQQKYHTIIKAGARLECFVLGENTIVNWIASIMENDRINHNKGPLCHL